ncbi:glycoside hydrolase family 5 protein [Mucilaginibacter paludis]|uniref:Glycoside hydrolase family 5 n=1 Tax=Mucilaginibacter paludis DSM 18603 TaxID=714943 RepID=H1YFL9_9SPHI|nr:cellulase family glycosylhydrolase [Mucilaginibacter paludis]EHQ24421.1 glycoside hydrolase family 5 [Mucilaginibacter paludis DSM 18603]
MKLKTALLMAMLCLSIKASGQGNGFFNTRGKEIIGPDNKSFLIRGTNLGNWLIPEGYMFKFNKTNAPRQISEAINELIGPDKAKAFWEKYLDAYITQPDIHYLKSIGVNSIRVPFHYKLFTNEDYLGANDPERGFKLLDRVIGWCRQEGIYVILDMHCAPGGQTGDNIDDSYGDAYLFENQGSRDLTIAIWKKIAARYKSDKTVMGYDLLNEPISTRIDTGRLNPYLEPLYKQITQAIRSVDKNHLLFLGGAQWDSNFKIFGAPFDAKLVYTFHKYWTKTTPDVIQQYVDFREKYNVPIYAGETGENNDTWVAEFRQLLEKNNIGWHYWPYKKMLNKSGVVEFKQPENYDKVIAYAESDRQTFDAIRKAKPANKAEVEEALNDFLKNCRFENCTPNNGYNNALGFK